LCSQKERIAKMARYGRRGRYYEDAEIIQERPARYGGGGGGGGGGFWLAIFACVAVGILVYILAKPSSQPRPAPGFQGYLSKPRDERSRMATAPATTMPAMQAAQIGEPRIDLSAVEDALWKTKGDNEKDFKGWMQRFEDEVNAIYFAALRQQKPNADPVTLLPKPVRIDSQRQENLLTLHAYIDQNDKPGYQNGEDKLIFVFRQKQPYNQQQRQLAYSLRDGTGYYYREPTYIHTVHSGVSPYFLGFFLFPAIWYGMWWRTSFLWHSSPMWWRSGAFYSRTVYYGGRYGAYRTHYRSNYYQRHRPMGWNRGAYYRQGAGGRFYPRGSYGGSARDRRMGSYGRGGYGGTRSPGGTRGGSYGGTRSPGGTRGGSYGGSRGGAGGKW
jgi:hypothetical protein